MQNIKKIFLIVLFLNINSMAISKPFSNPYNNASVSSEKLLGTSSETKIKELCKEPEKLGTQGEIGCAKYEWEKADKHLNYIYQNVLRQTKHKQILKITQKKWLEQRNKKCNTMYSSLHGDDVTQGGGTGVPMEFMDCMIEMAKERQKQLTIIR